MVILDGSGGLCDKLKGILAWSGHYHHACPAQPCLAAASQVDSLGVTTTSLARTADPRTGLQPVSTRFAAVLLCSGNPTPLMYTLVFAGMFSHHGNTSLSPAILHETLVATATSLNLIRGFFCPAAPVDRLAADQIVNACMYCTSTCDEDRNNEQRYH